MNLSLILPALIFGAIGAIIILFVVKVILMAIVGNPLSWLEKQRFVKKERILAQADQLQKQDLIEQSLPLLKQSFFLDAVRFNASLVDLSGNHNLGILARLVSISEQKNLHIVNLPLVEGLIASRHELSRSLFEIKDTLLKLRNRQKEKLQQTGKSSPDWALSEFSKKLSEVKNKIDANRQAIEAQLSILFVSLQSSTSTSEITYH